MIRKAKMIDAPEISAQLEQLGYPADSQLVADKIAFLSRELL